MKHFSKLPAVVLACVAAVSIFAACSPGGQNTPPPGQLPETNGNVLIAYFSHTGNTESVAQSLQGMTGADLFEIERETPYDLSIDDPEEEINSNARPPLADYLPEEDMAGYETVFVGYPIWYETMPAPVRTFLEHYDFSGKSVINFCTAASDGIEGSNTDFEESARLKGGDDVNVIFGQRFRRNETAEMSAWIESLGLSADGTIAPPDDVPTEPSEPTPPEEPTEPETPAEPSDEANILVVYFTWSNNTEVMATYIHEQTGGTLHQIEPVVPYPDTPYTEWGYDARDERDNDARPPIKGPLTQEEVSQYDTILIGFPIWWHTAPMIIGTFLESYTWTADVDIYLFFQGASNSNSEYYDNSMSFVRRCAVGATVHEGLYASHRNTSAIDTYLAENGFIS